MLAVAACVLAFGTKFDGKRVLEDDPMTETAVVKTRLTPVEKKLGSAFVRHQVARSLMCYEK